MTDGKVIPFPIGLKRYIIRDQITIPRRPWLMSGLLMRKQMTTLIASGGTGKSMLGLVVAIHLCAGRDFGPWKCIGGKSLKVAFLSVEEDADELDRRVHALVNLYGFDQDVLSNLFIVSSSEDPILAAPNPNTKAIRNTKCADELEKQLFRETIDVLVVDPFIEVWEGDENNNVHVKAAAAVIRRMIRRMNAACLLMHHVRKGTVIPGDIDAGRGASALSGLVRLAYTVVSMTADEADMLKLTSPKGFIRVDHAKGNYAPPPETAAWFRFEPVEVLNGDENHTGDPVGVLTSWTPPTAAIDAIKRPTGQTGVAFDALKEAIAEVGVVGASTIAPDTVKTVTKSQWRDYTKRHGLTIDDDNPETFKKAMQRAATALQESKLIVIRNAHVWIV
jgi:hypothetical protein